MIGAAAKTAAAAGEGEGPRSGGGGGEKSVARSFRKHTFSPSLLSAFPSTPLMLFRKSDGGGESQSEEFCWFGAALISYSRLSPSTDLKAI